MTHDPSGSDAGRIEWFDVARGGSILFVVLYHSILYYGSVADIKPLFGSLDNILQPIRMPLFFAISGFLASRAVLRGWKQIAIQRLAMLGYLFGIWTLVYWLFYRYAISNARSTAMGVEPWQLIEEFYRPSTTLWFLWSLLIYTVVGKATPCSLRIWVVVVGSVLSACCFGNAIWSAHFVYNNVILYSPFFLGACWYGAPFFRFIGRHAGPIAIAVLPCYFALYYGSRLENLILAGSLRFLLSVAGLILGCAIAACVSRIPSVKRPLRSLGRNTLPVFVGHDMAIATLTTIVLSVSADAPYRGYWAPPLTALAAVTSTLLLKQVCEKTGLAWLYRVPFLQNRQAGLTEAPVDAGSSSASTRRQ